MRPIKSLALLSLFLSSAGCAYAGADGIGLANGTTASEVVQGGVQIPIRQDGRHIIIRAKVNGKAEASFLLDTGSPVTVLFDTPAIAPLGIDFSKARRLAGSFGNSAENTAVPTGVIRSGFELDFGTLKLKKQRVVAVPVASMGCPLERFLSVGMDGIIGRDLFDRYVVEIDFDRHVMTLHDPATYQYRGPGVSVPFAGFTTGKPFLKTNWTPAAGAAPVPLQVLIDTGSIGGLNLYPRSNPGIIIPPDTHPGEISCGIGGTSQVLTGPATAIQLGGITAADVPTRYNPTQQRANDALIGMELLRRYNLIFDYSNKRMILQTRFTQ